MTEDKNKGLDSIQYNFMNLPVKVVKSDSTYQKYTYSAAGGKLVVESFNKSDSLLARTDYLGAFIYMDSVLQSIEHSEGRIIPGITAGTWEHQYHIKDHQGNNRLTFTTAPNTFEYLATKETSRSTLEESYFSNIDDTGVSVASYINHTPTSIVPSPSRAIRINNAVDNPQKVIGAAIPLQVFPGDTIKAEVFAKYQNYSSTNDDAIATMAAFMESAFGLPNVNGETQDIFDFMEGAPFLGLAAWNDLDETVPRAYLNYILLDKNFNFVDFGFEQVSSSAEIPGSNPSSHSHEKLSFDLPITEEGYIYLYVSNESQNNADVYFDDFKVTHVESKVVQTNDFYPFGLATESFSRLSNIPNKFLYNSGAELNEISGNYETFYRHYDPVLGRFNSIDPLASSFVSLTPYQYANNDPVLFNDPLGDRFAREHEFLPSATPNDPTWGGSRGGAGGGGRIRHSYNGPTSLTQIVRTLNKSEFGGTWNASGGYSYFDSHEEAALHGLNQIRNDGGFRHTEIYQNMISAGQVIANNYHGGNGRIGNKVPNDLAAGGSVNLFNEFMNQSILNSSLGFAMAGFQDLPAWPSNDDLILRFNESFIELFGNDFVGEFTGRDLNETLISDMEDFIRFFGDQSFMDDPSQVVYGPNDPDRQPVTIKLRGYYITPPADSGIEKISEHSYREYILDYETGSPWFEFNIQTTSEPVKVILHYQVVDPY